MKTTVKKICLVTPDISGFVFNGGVGTATICLARMLVRQGYEVDVLFANRSTNLDQAFVWWQSKFLEEGIHLFTVRNPPFLISHGHEYVRLSYAVYEQLKNTSYDRIIFSEMSGCGYFSLRAKESGLEFQQTDLWVMFHGPGLWHLRFNEALPTQFQQLTTHYMETESVFLADKVLFATEHSRNGARAMFGKLPADHEVILFPFEKTVPLRPYRSCEDLIFFGRLETRKGIEDFLKALVLIKEFLGQHKIRPVLMGSLGLIQGEAAGPKLQRWQKENGILLEIIEDKNHEQAWEEIEKRKGLVILSSHEETMGYTFVECLQKKVPFIYSSINAYQELSQKLTTKGRAAFASKDPRGLAQAMIRALRRPERHTLKEDAIRKLESDWKRLFNQKKKVAPKLPSQAISFSVCIPHYERFEFLKLALESVMAERKLISEIIIYDDASKACLPSLQKLQKSWKGIPLTIIYGRKNKGVSFARNQMAQIAKGSHLLFLDDDNQLNPHAIRDIRTTLIKTRADIVVSSLERVNLLDPSSPAAIWPPLGPDLSTNIFHNVIGDANCCIKRETFREVGGFNEELRGREDQEFFIRAHLKKAKFAIIPKPLIFYGLHGENAHLKVNDEANRRKFFQSVEAELSPGLTPLWELTQAWIYSQPATSVWEWTHGPISPHRSDWNLWPMLPKSTGLVVGNLFKNEVANFGKGLWMQLSKEKSIKPKLAVSEIKVKLTLWLPEITKMSTGNTTITLPPGRSDIIIGLRKNQKLDLMRVSGAKKILITAAKVVA